MGVVMIGVSCIGVGCQYFPMWGGMFFPAKKGATEEDYYFAEYSAAEREQGLHMASSAFVSTADTSVTLAYVASTPCNVKCLLHCMRALAALVCMLTYCAFSTCPEHTCVFLREWQHICSWKTLHACVLAQS